MAIAQYHPIPLSIFRRFLTLLLLCLLIAGSAHGNTQGINRKQLTAGEIALLPPYCEQSEASPSFKYRSERWIYWATRLGETFPSIHHYCRGLNNYRIAHWQGRGSRDFRARVNAFIGECDFVINYAKPGFPLLPEVLTKMGQAYVDLEQWDLALIKFEEAKSVKRDYWPPYKYAAEIYHKGGQNEIARELLEKAFHYSKGLADVRELYLKAGGKSETLDKVLAESNPASAEPGR